MAVSLIEALNGPQVRTSDLKFEDVILSAPDIQATQVTRNRLILYMNDAP